MDRKEPVKLPPELLYKIFCFLSLSDKGVASQVCHKWKSVIYHPSLWRGVQAKLGISNISNSVGLIKSLQRRQVTSISVKSFSHVTLLKSILLHGARFIVNLDLSSCRLTSSVLRVCMTRTLPRLRCLDLSSTSLSNKNLETVCLAVNGVEQLLLQSFSREKSASCLISIIVKTLRKLRDLDISHTDVYLRDISHLGQNSGPRLERLCVAGIATLQHDMLALITRRFQSLQHLDISGIRLHSAVTCKPSESLKSLRISRIETSSFYYIIPFVLQCCNLLALDMSDNQAVNDENLEDIAGHLPLLQVLKIDDCTGFTDAGLIHIVRRMSNLRVFTMNNVPVENFDNFISNMSVYLNRLLRFSCVGYQFSPSMLSSRLPKLEYVKFGVQYHAKSISNLCHGQVCPHEFGNDYFQLDSTYFPPKPFFIMS